MLALITRTILAHPIFGANFLLPSLFPIASNLKARKIIKTTTLGFILDASGFLRGLLFRLGLVITPS